MTLELFEVGNRHFKNFGEWRGIGTEKSCVIDGNKCPQGGCKRFQNISRPKVEGVDCTRHTQQNILYITKN